MKIPAVQTTLRIIYPPRCTICGAEVDSEFGLCGPCWRDTPFISGSCCDGCGAPLPGDTGDDDELCDDCLRIARPWARGRAAMEYRDNGRKLVLALKHGDRHEVVRPAAKWLARAALPFMTSETLIAPIPLHWLRMLRRTYNQSALLAKALGRETGNDVCLDLLLRPRRTRTLNGLSQDERFATLDQAIVVSDKRADLIAGRDVVLVDDVMTSGATFSAATQACHAAGAGNVYVLALARATKGA